MSLLNIYYNIYTCFLLFILNDNAIEPVFDLDLNDSSVKLLTLSPNDLLDILRLFLDPNICPDFLLNIN